MSSVPILAVVAALLIYCLTRLFSGPSRNHLPPGPPSHFLFGTSIPTKHPWRQFKEWTEEYGDIFTIRLGPKNIGFVLGTATSANAILEKQAGVSADRPTQTMANTYMSGGMRTLLMRHNDDWRINRKILHEALQDKSAANYEPIQLKESRATIVACEREKNSFQDQFGRYAASVIMTVSYDYPVTSLNDPLLKDVQYSLGQMGKWARPGGTALDHFPFLTYLPRALNPWRKIGDELHKKELGLFLGEYLKVKKRAEQGNIQNCFSTSLQEKQAGNKLNDKEASYLAGSLFGAGSDTTASALSVFVMAMIRFPEVQKRAQEEVEKVVGPLRMPTFDDIQSLPYIRAMIQEIGRWRPVSAGGFLHALSEDVKYKNFVLPKGSCVIGNHWSISLDPKEYPEPDVFKPERFLDADGQVHGTWFNKSRGNVQFGFGRRICPGSHVADRSLFIVTTSLLWAFNISAPHKPEDTDTLAFDSRANSHPLPFKADFEYRSEKRKLIAEEEVEHTKDLHAA
ncbi:hypothetical protein CBS101457_001123 [Exobasidium rhododendri]|nr:hypothetical protein CBS101457_001123 [Exobasidium rhododendri]